MQGPQEQDSIAFRGAAFPRLLSRLGGGTTGSFYKEPSVLMGTSKRGDTNR